MKTIDLRSDTVTQPTDEMRQAMSRAEVGDDVYGDDPTVNRLEEVAAGMLGKEAAVFVPTGTMANQASIMAHTRPGDEIIAGAHSHIYYYEGGGPARLSGVSAALADNADGRIYAEDVHRLVRAKGNLHFPRTTLLCLENALSNGDVVPLEVMKGASEAAKEHGLKVHLDGARLFNAAAALDCSAADLAAYADSVAFCLSKGLCAPVGSMVCGNASFIDEVRRCRKVLGGGMRQAGVLAACGLISLKSMIGRLKEDHENARRLASLLAGERNITVADDRVKINMVFWQHDIKGFDDQAFIAFMSDRGIKVSGASDGWYRLVTHHDITADGVDRFISAFREYTAALKC
ncbi:low-specificity L-threonine aldolase [Deltaproteobacteria bacterium Smac51]|nr:low-specificity L-threonine aldolase [Deltaproteobacteria bacterium Smac51]